MSDQVGEDRVRAREASAQAVLESEEKDSENSFPEFDAVLHDAHALVFVRGGGLLEDTTAVAGRNAPPESHNGGLPIGAEGYRKPLIVGDAEGPKELDGHVRSGIVVGLSCTRKRSGRFFIVSSSESAERFFIVSNQRFFIVSSNLGETFFYRFLE